jgi:hypothetical protein
MKVMAGREDSKRNVYSKPQEGWGVGILHLSQSFTLEKGKGLNL